LAGELTGARGAQFEAHIETCRPCTAALRYEREADAHLRSVVVGETPETMQLQRRIHHRIAARSRRQYIALAAGIAAFALLAGFGFRTLSQPPQVYADAAIDHHREIIEGQHRVWTTDPTGLEALARREGLAISIASLVPAGYRLECGKICRLNGVSFLHLVYSNNAGRYSLFLRPHPGSGTSVSPADIHAQNVAGFQTNRVEALCVGSGAETTRALARSLRAYL
jgi:anti-sigma factor RsiW